MTLKERAQVLYDFSHCPNNGKECKECAASGVICDIRCVREARDTFFKETANVLVELSKDE